MVRQQFDAVAELQTAFQVLKNNWILALPTAVASLVAIVFLTTVVAAAGLSVLGAGALSGHPGGAATVLGAGGLAVFGGFVLIILISIVAHAAVIAAAEDAWRGQPPNLARGVSCAIAKLPNLFVAGLLIMIPAIIFGVLSVFLIGIPLLLALGFVMMYVVPGIVVGPESGVSSLGASWRLATQNITPSIIAFVGIAVAYVVQMIVSAILGHIPILGWIIGFLVGGLTSAFAALVSVRFYDLLRGTAPSATVTVNRPG